MRLLTSCVFLLAALSPVWGGECMRLVPEQRHQLGTDGPGAFGPLHGLLTLGCLRFVDTEKEGDHVVAILVDEKNKRYRATPGTWIGESGGRITEITATRISLSQIVLDAQGEYIEVPRYIFREASK